MELLNAIPPHVTYALILFGLTTTVLCGLGFMLLRKKMIAAQAVLSALIGALGAVLFSSWPCWTHLLSGGLPRMCVFDGGWPEALYQEGPFSVVLAYAACGALLGFIARFVCVYFYGKK